MRMGDELLREFYENGRSIRRTSWPAGDHIDTDGAEGGTIWYYSAENDDLKPDYRLGFHDLGTDEWEFVDGEPVDPDTVLFASRHNDAGGMEPVYIEPETVKRLREKIGKNTAYGKVGIVPRDDRHHAELDATHRKHPDGSYFK